MTLVKIREREDFHQVDKHIVVFLRKDRTIIATTKTTVLVMTEIGAQAEREISDNRDLDPLHRCTQIDSEIAQRSEIFMLLRLNLLETFIFGFILETQKFRKTCRAPQKDSLS
jgi:hypothetical protein